jgi:hypothetical protein
VKNFRAAGLRRNASRNFLLSLVFHSAEMNSTEEQDDLWRLLGKARPPAVSPFFSRNVLREVRQLQQERPGIAGWLQRHWRWQAPALACALAAMLAAAFLVEPKVDEDPEMIALAEDVSASPDYDVIHDLDELLAWEESSVWLDANIY